MVMMTMMLSSISTRDLPSRSSRVRQQVEALRGAVVEGVGVIHIRQISRPRVDKGVEGSVGVGVSRAEEVREVQHVGFAVTIASRC